eukprot:CAMPEP_0198155680 /NCGR_PEP_ID=MMETSP1443-20131203/69259_1 /TAXON_ID=186043 /ORGANISM="Entomoneis sp., Strain CCMP2396" /LENGTH=249 /DNA_ID=CAMNT_0043822437 /DNA_START=566 /DNA_END=1313 /DNA_ORIENTATION=-
MTVKPDMIVHNVDRTETKIVAAEEPEPITAPTEKSVVSGEMEAEDRPADIETGIVGINVQKAQDTSNVKDSEEDNKDVGNSLFAEGDEGLLCGLPLPGQTISTTADEEQVKRESRDVANSCAVCLSQFEVDEKLCWSGNPECLHVFHQECITDWFQATGRKHLKKIRLENSDQGRKFLVKEATNFSMACPCCRQVFVVDENEQEEQAGEAQNNSDHQETVEAIGTSESNSPEPRIVILRNWALVRLMGS